MRAHTTRITALLALGALAFAAAPCAHAQAERLTARAAQPAGSTEALVARLDDPEYAVRRAALDQLVALPTLSDELIRDRLVDDALTPEQRLALESVLYQRFAQSPVGAVGISFAGITDPERRGLKIGAVSENFPAVEGKMIQTNDLILSVDGVDLAELLGDKLDQSGVLQAQREVQIRVFSRKPGETVPMTILRTQQLPGREKETVELEFDIPLGNYQRHERAQDLADNMLADAYTIRLERLGIEANDESAPLPTSEIFWPPPNVGVPMRLARNGMVPGPTSLVDVYNRLDPYAPRRAQETIRNEFATMTKRLLADNAEARIVPGLRRQAVAGGINNIRLQQRLEMEAQMTRDRASGYRVIDTPPSPAPVIDRIASLRDEVQRLTRAIAHANDPTTRSLFEDQLNTASDELDTLAQELRARSEPFTAP